MAPRGQKNDHDDQQQNYNHQYLAQHAQSENCMVKEGTWLWRCAVNELMNFQDFENQSRPHTDIAVPNKKAISVHRH
jgi:hypothetical protein